DAAPVLGHRDDAVDGAVPTHHPTRTGAAQEWVRLARGPIPPRQARAGAEQVVVMEAMHNGDAESACNFPDAGPEPGQVVRVNKLGARRAQNGFETRPRGRDEIADVVADPA